MPAFFTKPELVNLIEPFVRWIHVFFAILWIGQTHLFGWMDHLFHQIEDGQAGEGAPKEVWMVHSGGFYEVYKKKKLEIEPQFLHWFRLEAGGTWLTGMLLLILNYYLGGLMVDPTTGTITESQAIHGSVVFLLVTFAAYDLFCESPLGRDDRVVAVVGYVGTVGLAYALMQVLSGRAAYIHIGAMYGTIMAANVFMRIIPGQKKTIACMVDGTEPDPYWAERAKRRSKHNGFMVMPVMFLMISNHYFYAYGESDGWITLGIIVAVGWFLGLYKNRI